jgi:F-type H+-transporting ATPase subunit b
MQIDASFFALVGLILFFVLLVYVGVHTKLGQALDKRATSIAKDLDDAKRLREEATALLADYQRRSREAEAEAQTIVDKARREAAALADQAKADMEDYVARRTKMAEEKITQAEHQALQEVKALSADVSIAAAEKILAAKLSGAAGADLVAASIADVKNRLN